MNAAKRAVPFESWPAEPAADAREAVAGPQAVADAPRAPALRLLPLLRPTQTRRFVRIPTHAVGVYPEQREYPRAKLKLPLRLRSVGGMAENFPISLVMRDISSTGIYFLCPKALALGTAIELEVVLVSKPLGRGSVVMASMARVLRIENANMPGWYGIAATFDEFEFDRDDHLPSRFLKP